MPYKNYKLGIVILNYGDPQLSFNLVKSLIKTKEKFYIVIVDNFSTKNNLRKLENFVINCKQKFIYLKRSKKSWIWIWK